MDPEVLGREPLPSRELAAFVAAIEAGSIGAAAHSLSLTQSAVTKRVQNLERHVGCSLLKRSHGGVQPTAAGEALYPEAKAALASLARAAETLDRGRVAGESRLRISASHTIGTFLLPGWLAAFEATGPATPQVSVVNSFEVIAALYNRRADIGFLPDAATLDDLDALEVGQDELVVVVGREHAWASGESVAPTQLNSQPFFTREEGSGTRAASLAGLRRLGVELQPALETSSTEALKLTVRRSGFTMMSSLAITDEIRHQQLRPLRVIGGRMARRLFAVKRHDAQGTGATRRFWGWLEANCPSGPAATASVGSLD